MIKIEIKEARKDRREITSKKDGKQMVFYEQGAYAHTLDRNGQPFEVEADGLLAVALQHENDHLDGVLMIDKLSALKKKMMGRKLAKAKLDDARD